MPGQRFTFTITQGPFKGSCTRIVRHATPAEGFPPNYLFVQSQDDPRRDTNGQRITYPAPSEWLQTAPTRTGKKRGHRP